MNSEQTDLTDTLREDVLPQSIMSADRGNEQIVDAVESPIASGETLSPTDSPASSARCATSSSLSSLYVTNLEEGVTEARLFELFSAYGSIYSIRLCPDSTMAHRSSAASHRVHGSYAYINFTNHEEAEDAFNRLNGQSIDGQRPLSIQWSLPPSLPPNTNLFVKYVADTVTTADLKALFEPFGRVLSVKVGTNFRGDGYGFVLFEESLSASRAIHELNGFLLAGQRLQVSFHHRRERRVSPFTVSPPVLDLFFTNLYVKNLTAKVDDAGLRAMFIPFGNITSCVVATDDHGQSRGFGFVNFEEHEAAVKAVNALNGLEIDGRPLYVGRAQRKNERDEVLRQRFDCHGDERLSIGGSGNGAYVNVYVKHLTDAIDEEELRNAFCICGPVLSVRIMRDADGVSRGFGFVRFPTMEHAHYAVSMLNGRVLPVQPTQPIFVALAQRQERQHVFPKQQFMLPPSQTQPPMFQTAMYPFPTMAAAGFFPPGTMALLPSPSHFMAPGPPFSPTLYRAAIPMVIEPQVSLSTTVMMEGQVNDL